MVDEHSLGRPCGQWPVENVVLGSKVHRLAVPQVWYNSRPCLVLPQTIFAQHVTRPTKPLVHLRRAALSCWLWLPALDPGAEQRS